MHFLSPKEWLMIPKENFVSPCGSSIYFEVKLQYGGIVLLKKSSDTPLGNNLNNTLK